MVTKPIVLTFSSLFSTMTLHKTRTFLHILDDEPMKTFGSGQSCIIIEHKTKDFAGLRPYSSSMFAPLLVPFKTAEFHNHSLLLIVFSLILNAYEDVFQIAIFMISLF